MSILAAEASHVACNNPFLFDKMKEYLQDIISSKHGQGNEDDGHRSFVNDDAFQPNRDHVLVGDPIKVFTKGAPKQSTKGHEKGGPSGD